MECLIKYCQLHFFRYSHKSTVTNLLQQSSYKKSWSLSSIENSIQVENGYAEMNPA